MTRPGMAPPGYRLPDETYIASVRLQVADLDRSISYYEKVLGMSVLDRGEGRAELGSAQDKRALIKLVEKQSARQVPRRGLLGLYHFAVLLPDRAALGRFIAHLSEIGAYAGMSDHKVSEAVYLTDPDGLGIEVYADRPRDTWNLIDSQLEMSTKPLNVPDVVAAAAGKKWDGIPAGTRIGHVHFYVGDIDEAAKFYHAGLGMDKIVWNYPGALFMSAGGYHHHVGVNTWAAGASPATDDDAKLMEWNLVVPDVNAVQAAAASLAAAGYDVRAEGSSATADDSWGIRLHLTAESESD